jgi:hypothetical protein
MKSRNHDKKLKLNKKTIAHLTLDRMKKLRGGIPPVTTMCYTLITEVLCCTVHTNCGQYTCGQYTCVCTAKCLPHEPDTVDTAEC